MKEIRFTGTVDDVYDFDFDDTEKYPRSGAYVCRAAVYGADGLPFKHEFRSGRIYAEDIWDIVRRSTNSRERSVGLKLWFGER